MALSTVVLDEENAAVVSQNDKREVSTVIATRCTVSNRQHYHIDIKSITVDFVHSVISWHRKVIAYFFIR